MGPNEQRSRATSPRPPLLILIATPLAALAVPGLAIAQAATARAEAPPSRWDVWINLAEVAGPLATVGALLVAVWTIRSSIRSWKWTFFTKEWSALVLFLHQNPGYMEKARTNDYQRSFIGDEALRYEMVARLCIGYLDDLYFLGSRREIRTWFRGSVNLLAVTHRQWLKDHPEAYHPGFYKFIMGELEPAAKKRAWWRSWSRPRAAGSPIGRTRV